MGRVRALLACSECGQPSFRWTGRCAGCGAWGSIQERPSTTGGRAAPLETLLSTADPDRRVPTGLLGLDRVLGGGLVPGSVILLAGEPGIGKSTLLLQVVANLSAAGLACLLASGEESRAQVAARARRLSVPGDRVAFALGRELPAVVEAALSARPFLLAVDSVQTIRDPGSAAMAGGTAQVRACADRLVGLAKAQGITVILTGHVTKEGYLAGPRTLEHAVDVVLTFEGDAHSGLRLIASGKNRFGQDGEVAWFEMRASGLVEVDPAEHLAPGGEAAGSATALALAGRRALAVEVQALAVPSEGPPRRRASGIDLRRFELIAAVVDRRAGVALARSELYASSSGGYRIDEPGCDLAVAAALASAATGVPPPPRSAFVGEVALTGRVRPAAGMDRRLAAAEAAGLSLVFGPEGPGGGGPVRLVPVRDVRDALGIFEGRGSGARSTGRRNPSQPLGNAP